jgi:hypothetical protein
VSDTGYRIIFLMLGLALIAVVAFFLLLSPQPDEAELPAAIEMVAPADGDTVLRQTDLVVNMAVGYEIEVFIDGVPVPPSEIETVEATGRRTWAPGPGKVFAEWSPGTHTVVVVYERVAQGVDFGEYRWTFRVQ